MTCRQVRYLLVVVVVVTLLANIIFITETPQIHQAVIEPPRQVKTVIIDKQASAHNYSLSRLEEVLRRLDKLENEESLDYKAHNHSNSRLEDVLRRLEKIENEESIDLIHKAYNYSNSRLENVSRRLEKLENKQSVDLVHEAHNYSISRLTKVLRRLEKLENEESADLIHKAHNYSISRLKKVLRRLEKLENEVSQLKRSPKSLSNGGSARRRHCPIPTDWRYPFCGEKVEWLRRSWNTNPGCYIDKHSVDPLDECSMLYFLSETEAWCPIQPGREAFLPQTTTKEKARMRTDLDGLLAIIKDDRYKWIRERITRMWPMWLEGAKSLQKRKEGLNNRMTQNILLLMGAFIAWPSFFTSANKGGPLGELVQWSDLLASLYILGHTLTVCSNKAELSSLLNVPPDPQCASKMTHRFDRLYLDYDGHKYINTTVGPNRSQYMCRERIIDSFGTEAEFNLAVYGGTIPGGRSSDWGDANLSLRQFMTMFPHSPDNTFLGFVVDGPVPQHRQKKRRKSTGLVYGKEARFWVDSRSYLDTLHKYLEIHATVAAFKDDKERSYIPNYVVNHGYLGGGKLMELLGKTKVFIGLGFPYEGPAPIEAIARGCVFLNAKFDPPHNRMNTAFFKDKPTLRSLTSQHPYAEQFIGKPHVYTVDIKNTSAVDEAIRDILKQQVYPYLPLEWTPEGMLERLNGFVEHLDFCSNDAKPWPPQSEARVYIGNVSQSCKDVCMDHGLLCEPSYFMDINSFNKFKRFNLTCKNNDHKSVLHAPSYSAADQSCVLQAHPLLFSCVYSDSQRMRICPCRDFQREQVALCKNCS